MTHDVKWSSIGRWAAILLAGFGVACGGPESDVEDEYGSSDAALVAAPWVESRATASTGSAPTSSATESSSGTAQVALVVSGSAQSGQTAFRVDGDSSPDPIPARSPDDARRARAECERFPKGFWRDACFYKLAQGR